MARIRIENVSKRYGSMQAVRELSLEVHDSEFVTLLGPSGCGKTTTLRMLAGFLRPDAGRILVDDQVLSTPEAVVPPERRGMGMVFQNYALWPHKTVYENVVFGLEVRRVPREEAKKRVAQVLALVKLTGLENRYPSQLSGGQQQRVALARSLVVEPRILLLDEPLSNLDAKLREQMRWELKELQKRTGITFIYVTHDQAEAMALSDRIAVLHDGQLQQFGTPREVYSHPANRTVAEFMGLVNVLRARALRVAGPHSEVAIAKRYLLRPALPSSTREGEELELIVRPENIELLGSCDGDESLIPARLVRATFLGNMNDYDVVLEDGTKLRVQGHSWETFEAGQQVFVRLDAAHCVVVRS